MLQTSPSSPLSQSPTSVWLEHLPQVVLHRIVEILQECYHTRETTIDTYSLAFVSESLRQSVQKSLEHKVSLFSTEGITPAVTLFPSGIKSLRICDMPTEHPALLFLLRASTLETVSLPADEHLTSALQVKKSVRHLELDIHTQNHGEHVMALLEALSLTRLSLSCFVHAPAKACLFNSELSNPQHENCIAELCPDLEELHVKCARDDRNAIFWRMFPKLSLKHARLHRNVRKEALHQLRGMESVALENVKDPVYHAERLEGCVTSFRTSDILDDVDLRIMQSCPRLHALEISLKVKHSNELRELVELLPQLRVLAVTFNRHTMYSGKRGRVCYDSMDDGDVARLIQAGSHLEEIELYGVMIPGKEVVDVLRILGGSLKRFETSLKGQEEGIFERLERLLEALCRYNNRLEEFEVWETFNVSGIKSNLRRKGKDLARRRRKQRDIGRRLNVLIGALRRRSRWIEGPGGHRGRGIGELVEVLL